MRARYASLRRRASYKVGDHVFALPGSEEEDMYIAQIDGIFEDEDGEFVDCIWLERSKDVEGMVGARAWKEIKGKVLPGEVFLCTTINTNPIQSIEGHANILTLERYEAERRGKRAAAAEDEKETFVCRRALILNSHVGKKKQLGSFTPVVFDEKRGFFIPPPPPKGKPKR